MPRPADRLRFGPAGVPHRAKGKDIIEALKVVKALGLDAMELEFVRGIWLKPEKARVVKEVAKELDIWLTAHAPYYINLAAKEEAKVEKSIRYIIDSARVLYLAGGWSVVFHPGWYMKRSPSLVYEKVKQALSRVIETLKQEGIDVWIRPETMELKSKFGDLDEVIRLSQELDMVLPCIDFAHLRYREGWNSKEEFRYILEKIEKELGRFALDNMHIHISGIKLDKRGTHLNLNESDLRWQEILEVLKEFNVKGVVISESPNLEDDGMMMRDYWLKITEATV